MISKELQEIIDELNNSDEMIFQEPITLEDIILFEKKHKINIPDQYKEWLLFSDGGEVFLPAGVQFYGISHKPFISFEDTDRPSDIYYIIGSLASGDPLLCEKNSKKVSIYNREAGKIEDDEVYDDFYSFMKDLKNILGLGG